MGCKMNNEQGVTVSCRVNDCKAREEVDNDSGQFVLSKPAFECNSLIVVGTVG